MCTTHGSSRCCSDAKFITRLGTISIDCTRRSSSFDSVHIALMENSSQRRRGRSLSKSPTRTKATREKSNDKPIDPNFSFCKFISELPDEGIRLMTALSLTCSGAFCFFFWIASCHEGRSFHIITSILHKTFHHCL
jgi:hypothetical protein